MSHAIVFPIEGMYRDILLGLEVVITFAAFQYCVLFIWQYSRRQKNFKAILSHSHNKYIKEVEKQIQILISQLKNREFSWGLMFFFLAMMYLFYIIGDFYAGDATTRSVFLLAGYLFFMLGIGLLSYSLEGNELHSTEYFYSKIYLIFLILMFVFVLFFPRYAIWPATLASFLTFILLIQYSKHLINRSQGLQKMKLPIFSLFIGLLSLLIGFFLTTDLMVHYFGLFSRLIGDLIQLSALALCAIAFYFLPNFFDEFSINH